MTIAAYDTRGIRPATMNAQPIPEIGVAPDTALDDAYDIHFGINVKRLDDPDSPVSIANPVNALYQNLDPDNNDRDKALVVGNGLGPRTIEMRRRGGRTAEHDYNIHHYTFSKSTRDRRVTALGDTGLTQDKVTKFNRQIPIKDAKRNFPQGAKIGTVDVSGQAKGYHRDATTKNDTTIGHGIMLDGVRWSKTALEYALSRGRGNIHFHLTGLGELSNIFDKSGDYSHNVTASELRYVKRWWMRFQDKVIFYNGYTNDEKAVMVQPPWLKSAWQDDTGTCGRCAKKWSTIFPIRLLHHCRMCGKCVCDDCSPRKLRLRYPVMKTLANRHNGTFRVCTPCYDEAHGRLTAPSNFG
jgi:hypothetical protein